MSYRRSKATTERIRRQIEAMRRGKERAAMAGVRLNEWLAR